MSESNRPPVIVRKPKRERRPQGPRQYWAVGGIIFRDRGQAEFIASEDGAEVIHLIEVMPKESESK